MPLVAGVDCSTQSTKVLVVDAESGAVVAEGRAPHELRSAGAASETDPVVWLDALRAALAGTGRAADVAAVSVAAQQHGLVLCDAAGAPVRPAVLWNDTRSSAAASRLAADLGHRWWAEEVGVVPVPSITVTTWAWLREVEPSSTASAAAVRLPHDWLTERLTGRAVTDRGDASGTGWWSAARGAYVEEVLDHPAVALDRARLPEVLGPAEPAGEVVDASLGLRPGTIVGPGTGDNMAAALGLGLTPGLPVMSLGTSGTVYVVSERPARDPSGVVAGFADATGRYLPLACTLNATLAVDRVAALLGLDREAAADHSGSVVVVPYLDGERTPNLPDATGTVVGLTRETSPGEILRAAYEGVVVSLLDALERVAGDSGAAGAGPPIVLVGGGARGAAYLDVVRRLSGRAVEVPAAGELVALGAAAQAASLLTGEEPDEVARRWCTRRGVVLEPLDRDVETLDRHRRVRAALAGLHAG